LRRATNIVSAVDDHFLEVIFERGDEPGVTALEGVGAAGDSGCPAFLDVDGSRFVAGLNSWGDGGNGIRVGQYGARDYQTRVSRYLEWIDDTIATTPDPPEEPEDPDAPEDPADPDEAGDDADGTDGGCSTTRRPSAALGLLLPLLAAARRRRRPS
jgi:hypothetical protein